MIERGCLGPRVTHDLTASTQHTGCPPNWRWAWGFAITPSHTVHQAAVRTTSFRQRRYFTSQKANELMPPKSSEKMPKRQQSRRRCTPLRDWIFNVKKFIDTKCIIMQGDVLRTKELLEVLSKFIPNTIPQGGHCLLTSESQSLV